MSILKKFYNNIIKTGSNEIVIDSTNSTGFERPHYLEITRARLEHLKSLKLSLDDKSVIDMGCGIGHLSEFFVNNGCEVLCIDGRQENIQTLRKLYPDYKSVVCDIESIDFTKFDCFDIVFCYGLLYHLSDPFGFLKNIFKICKDFTIIETCITDAEDPVLFLVKENFDDQTQALDGIGCRPSRSYVIKCLKLGGFKYVYEPKKLPDHKEFKYKLVNDYNWLKDGSLIRTIFVASHNEILNDRLREV